ncbi:hypothetical protein JG688_00012527 [Phytophthora aleatoria]|uniref:Uncharacterized protein n=1 Tax=Phytophthora aleatoria TaxID=2496075 RepID=A0A8J5MEC1_9STRA|nr:hypothetical protein JG688_00012527 [Phytophthora aleatoria]
MQLIVQHTKPNRIRHDILDRYEPERGSVSTLTQVQKFISNDKRTKLNETDLVEDMQNLASCFKFYEDMPDGASFSFDLTLGRMERLFLEMDPMRILSSLEFQPLS